LCCHTSILPQRADIMAESLHPARQAPPLTRHHPEFGVSLAGT
jgi:hypothetical protein